MAGVSMTKKARAIALAAVALAAIVAIAGSCSDPGLFLKAVNDEAKSSLDMFLEVTSVSPANGAAAVNPSSEIKIDFDRPLDLSTVIADNITIAKAGGGSALGWSSVYDSTLRRLSLKLAGIDGGADYVVTIGEGLRGSQGELLRDPEIWSFSTLNIPGGALWINATVNPDSTIQSAAYTRLQVVDLFIKGNTLVSEYWADETEEDLESNIPLTPANWTSIPFTLSPEQGEHTIWLLLTNNDASLKSSHISASIYYDSVPPNVPTGVTISSLTTHTPTWTWSSGKTAGAGETEGNGTYGYRLYSFTTSSNVATGQVSSPNYTSPGIPDGSYRLFVTEYDAAGNASAEANSSIDAVNAPPAAPTVSSASLTVDATPTWTWTHDAFGSGNYRYVLDPGEIFVWSTTTNTSYTSSSLSDGLHTLYVREQDSGGEWSASGTRTIHVSSFLPYAGQSGVSTSPTFVFRDAFGDDGVIEYEDSRDSWVTWATLKAGNTSIRLKDTLPTSRTFTWHVRFGLGKFATYYPSYDGVSFITTTRGF